MLPYFELISAYLAFMLYKPAITRIHTHTAREASFCPGHCPLPLSPQSLSVPVVTEFQSSEISLRSSDYQSGGSQ